MYIMITGSELFTGNTMFMFVALMDKRCTWKDLIINWSVSYIGNFIGCVLCAFILGWVTDLYSTPSTTTEFVTSICVKKCKFSFVHNLFRGIGANILVNLTIILCVASDDIISKLACTWASIFSFVAIGFEHSVANMFFIPMGLMYGADVGFGTCMWQNMLPVTIGNIFSGSLVVGLSYWFKYLTEIKTAEKTDAV